MRIIAGKFKGRKIDFISNEKTRPTSSMVRESLFSKIQFDITDSVFLDLFAGSGGIGFEALSRGAKEVFFVEKNRKNFEIIKKNLKTLYGENYEKTLQEQKQNAHLINSDFATFLNNHSPCHFDRSGEIPSSSANNNSTIFDFIYIDPPYKSEFYNTTLQKLKDNKLITNKSLIICEHDLSSTFINKNNLKDYQIVTQKKHGTKMLSYLKLL